MSRKDDDKSESDASRIDNAIDVSGGGGGGGEGGGGCNGLRGGDGSRTITGNVRLSSPVLRKAVAAAASARETGVDGTLSVVADCCRFETFRRGGVS